MQTPKGWYQYSNYYFTDQNPVGVTLL